MRCKPDDLGAIEKGFLSGLSQQSTESKPENLSRKDLP